MDEHKVEAYILEAKTQCELCLNAIRSLNHNLNAIQVRGVPNSDRMHCHQEVFRSIHSLLTHSSNLSKLFWPPKTNGKGAQRTQARGAVLRRRIGLPDTGHFLQDRKIRNHLEHFDERLDDWEENSERHNLVQDTIGPPSAISGVDASDMMRGYDPNSKTFTFRGEEYNIQQLADSVDDLYRRVAAESPF